MKKSIIPALLLSVTALAGLASCGGNDDNGSTTPPVTTPTPGPSGEKTIAQLISENFTGTPGEYTDGKYTLALKEATGPEVTVTGTYISGAEWTYYNDKRSGYIMDEAGDVLFLHTAEETTSLKQDIKVGAKIKVKGTLTAYNGYPQIGTGWTYELVSASTAESVTAVESKYTVVKTSDLIKTGTESDLILTMARKPVLLKNMVLTGTISQDGLSYFTPLEEIGKADASRIGVYRFHYENQTSYLPGNVFDIYGLVTSYKGAVQLHTTSQSTEDTFAGVRKVSMSELTPEQKLIIGDLQTTLERMQTSVNIDYVQNPEATDVSLPLPAGFSGVEGLKMFFKAEAGEGADASWFAIESDGIRTSLVIKALPGGDTNKTGKVVFKRRVCAAEDCADEAAAFALTDTTKFKEQTVTITVKHIYKVLNSVEATFTGSGKVGTVSEGIHYITNNADYPDPSFGSDTYVNSLKLAYANGGFETEGSFDFGTSTKVRLNLAVANYGTKTDREVTISVSALDANGEILATVTTDNLWIEGNAAFRDFDVDLTQTGEELAHIAKIKVVVITSKNATLYVKSMVAPAPAASEPETPTPGA